MVKEHSRPDSPASPDPAKSPRQEHPADEVWKQAATLREVLRDEETRTQRRRAEAEAARRAAEEQVLEATRQVCEQIRARAEQELLAAEEARAEAERVLAAATAQAQQLRAEADAKLHRAQEAQQQVEAAIIEAKREANDIRDRMRRQAAEEIREMLADIEALRSAARQELETQRIVTETARIRAVSPIEVNIPEVGPLNLVASSRVRVDEPAADEGDAKGLTQDEDEPSKGRARATRDIADEGEASSKRRVRGKSAA